MPAVRFPISRQHCQKHAASLWLVRGDDAFLCMDALRVLHAHAKSQAMRLQHHSIKDSEALSALIARQNQRTLFQQPTCHHVTLKQWSLKKEATEPC